MKCEWGAEIFFGTTVNGKKMPLDSDPNPAGTVALVRTGTGIVAMVVKGVPAAGETRYMPHWATCSNAGKFRRAT